mgnify:FL=1
MKTFAIVLKELRNKNGLTQEQLAANLGVSKSLISMYENGHRMPTIEGLEQIADYFNVDINYLRGKTNFTSIITNLNNPLNKMEMSQKIKALREKHHLTLEQIGEAVGVSKTTVQRWESGNIANMRRDKLAPLAKALQTTPAYLMGWEDEIKNNPSHETEEIGEIINFPILGAVAAGYNGLAVEEYTGDYESIPVTMLNGLAAQDCFVLRVKGNSMYPRFLDGDRVLVHRCSIVDSGAIAVVVYNGDEGTIKEVRYDTRHKWIDLVPINPEYETKHITGPDLDLCYIQGKVTKLIRDI